ncbi:RagB/SusD family nutrient uptake outer membrane protein [Mucilaginibacter rubeus]|uniref:RagB/SusD family nutrient uptake outer membrane protein n=1 Tax=Mucilaginibacter rubeus TaxID=2027860 RepID=A0AAE6JD20_9SPHI|nr:MULTISPECIES: RagB/SusD family nutrient uptake outer membrane protein [Mucilaginibacter]QEM03432.1 RagB/SusD family nutrient uptake outer membrane protein [Mucilaginibacter rubeus]QEM16047.1 RagB/SusD family nutrient uptake outer membrane protein [Mucilaginibacter gossypii]QTE41202.1 RagB/SusD family nutrient uptake outer membrane protein [Mucilaginibacter rubeus]QTE47806.1 RagB/SusD family nutrient uptake outer membrane protein [Mucilaginibacter rubeus]QTE59197.1 RagB/SusD family nutrient 
MKTFQRIKFKAIGITAIMLLFVIAGCRKELDYTPEVFVSAQSLYKDQAGAIAGVTGIYQQLQTLKKSDYQLIGVIGTDEARCAYQAQGYGSYWAGVVGIDVYDLTFNSQNADISGFWGVCYKGIANANAAVLNIPQIKNFGDASLQNRLVGEARFLRAVYYFYLVQLFGDVPMPLENTAFDNGVPRTPQATVYNQIISDLKFASTNCWAKSQLGASAAGRANMEAAKALLGKVYLTLHDYQNAKTTFEELINGNKLTLLANYADLFDGQHENNTESLFEIQYSTDNNNNTQGLQNLYGSYAGPPVPFQQFNQHTPGYGGTVITSTAFYADTVFAKPYSWAYQYDARYKASISHDRYDSNGNTMSWWADPGLPTVKKYDISSSDIDVYHSGKNLYYLRAADVFLMYAETLNELGQTQAALVPLNKIRERAFGNSSVNYALTDQVSMREIILDERTRELGAEGWRWFDLKRTGTLISRVKRYDDPKRDFMKKNNSSTDPHPTQEISSKNLLYPIPLSELQNNAALGLKAQNPGY